MIRGMAVILWFALGAAAQQLTVTPATIPGIELTGPGSEEYAALVTEIVGPERPVGLAASLAYGVVIRNRTEHALAAVDTVWTAEGRILLNAADATFQKPILYVKPGEMVLAIPPGILRNPRALQLFANGTTEGHRLENFQNPGKVTVAVDAVVFESGEFAGANRYGAFELWQAQLQAPRDLAASVLQKRGSQSVGEVVSWMEGLAAVRRPPPDPHAQQTIFSARVLLAIYRSKGEAELYARAQGMMDAPVFPLHR